MIDLKKSPTIPSEKADKKTTKKANKKIFAEIAEYQDVLYAEGEKSLLIVLQGMDAAGKNSATKKVLRNVNPVGLSVSEFGKPTDIELAHDFLWRVHKLTPAKGMMQVFIRSHYEDVVDTRVKKIIDDDEAEKRFAQINQFEELLSSNNTYVLKFFLHISEEEQKQRFKKRMLRPDKHWKFSSNDFLTSQNREQFLNYYEQVFENCNDPFPWTIVPADKKWYARHIIATKILEVFKSMELEYPPLET